MSPGQRGNARQHAKRVNVGVRLLATGLSVSETSRALARRFAVSERQARRYAETARDLGLRQVPESKVVFTIKLPLDLARRLRRNSKSSRRTLSSLVAQALEEFLARMPGGTHGGG